VRRDNAGRWIRDAERECPAEPVALTEEMKALKEKNQR
jgi:hypothetical protein